MGQWSLIIDTVACQQKYRLVTGHWEFCQIQGSVGAVTGHNPWWIDWNGTVSSFLVKLLYWENVATHSSCLIGSEICDENGLGLIQSSARTMHNSPSSNTYPAISNFLVKLLYWENVVTCPSHLISAEICDKNWLVSIWRPILLYLMCS